MDSAVWVEDDYDCKGPPSINYENSYGSGNNSFKPKDDSDTGYEASGDRRRGRGRGMGIWERRNNDSSNWEEKDSNDYRGRNSENTGGNGTRSNGGGRGMLGRSSSNTYQNGDYRSDRLSDRNRGRVFEGKGRKMEGGNDDGFSSASGMERDRRGDGAGKQEKPKERYIPAEPTSDENLIFGSNISSGINFDKYDAIQVKVTGNNVIKPVSSFEECDLDHLLLNNIIKSDYSKPTPVQKHALPIICAGRDLMACAQTGSGKTAAFLIPIINSLLISSPDGSAGRTVEPQVVICSPTRELAIQIYNEARKFSYGSCLKICIAYGGTVVFHQSRNISRGCNILVATPGRLNDFVNRNVISFSQVQFLVLDEADLMLDMGFLPAIEQIINHRSMTHTGERQTIMLSATFPEAIQRLAANYLDDYLFLAVGIVGGACSDVKQVFYEVRKYNKTQKLVDILTDNSSSENCLTLVFVERKRTADFLAAFLSESNFPTTSIHGDRLQSQREEALRHFKSGQMPILVATAVAARGLDIKNVSHVLNYDLPSSVEEYVHRIGRTGRVGNSGLATSFYDPNENAGLAEHLVRILEQSGQDIPSFLEPVRGFRHDNYDENEQTFGGMDVRKTVPSSFDNAGQSGLEEEDLWET